jgi:FeS assembly SUF system protein
MAQIEWPWAKKESRMDKVAIDARKIEAMAVEAIRTCYDPEIPVNIYELGLIYGVAVDPDGSVKVQMTLTSPNCPSAVELPGEVERKVRAIPGVRQVAVEITFDPPWEPSRMSEAARLELGMF